MPVKEFYDPQTSTLTYCVYDTATGDAVIIDPVMNYDPVNCKISQTSFVQLQNFVQLEKIKPLAVLETHVHADHWTGAQLVKSAYPEIEIVIGRGISQVFSQFDFLAASPLPQADQVFDRLVGEGEVLRFGTIKVTVLETPGHTPCCLTYQIGDQLFVGDLMFMPDLGTGRCDFPGGDARAMYNSVRNRIYNFSDGVTMHPGHDYPPASRGVRHGVTVGEQKKTNVALSAKVSEAEFVSFREQRDQTLNLPQLIFSSLQINLLAGKLPPPDAEGRRFLKIPYWQA